MTILGFGNDLLHIPRLANLLSRPNRLDAFSKRILTKRELDLLALVEPGDAQTRFLAVRWAAKESLYKALYPVFKPTWKDVSILPLPLPSSTSSSSIPLSPRPTGSKPMVVFEQEGQLADKGLRAHLSISHDTGLVLAGVIVEEDKNEIK
ncbi:PLA2G4, CPLA2 [Phaffia rhodozyma]|uniref:PLA2G4, CPLA2 n=1 Tax=Phaffia rhodozyma TaxID=264483 RepID=A0A0F7SSY2_PHARH|nr:PLA2G4, CPLA2 [Phaffia rhodozyma]